MTDPLDLTADGIYVVKPDATSFEDIEFTPLSTPAQPSQLRGPIGGYLEHIWGRSEVIPRAKSGYWDDDQPLDGQEIDFYLDEEGKLKGLQNNPIATMLMYMFSPVAPDDYIAGTLVIVCGAAREGPDEEEDDG